MTSKTGGPRHWPPLNIPVRDCHTGWINLSTNTVAAGQQRAGAHQMFVFWKTILNNADLAKLTVVYVIFMSLNNGVLIVSEYAYRVLLGLGVGWTACLFLIRKSMKIVP